MKYSEYLDPNTWIGGYYELSIEYHPSGKDNRIQDALRALYESKYFHGMWKEKEEYLEQAVSLPISMDPGNEDQYYGDSFYGILSISEDVTLPCFLSINRMEEESDWLDICIPQASFEKKYPYQYPLSLELNPWLQEVNEFFTKLAEVIHSQSPFDLAVIGEEVSGETNQEEIRAKDLDNEYITFLVPIFLQNKLGVRDKGKERCNGLRVY